MGGKAYMYRLNQSCTMTVWTNCGAITWVDDDSEQLRRNYVVCCLAGSLDAGHLGFRLIWKSRRGWNPRTFEIELYSRKHPPTMDRERTREYLFYQTGADKPIPGHVWDPMRRALCVGPLRLIPSSSHPRHPEVDPHPT